MGLLLFTPSRNPKNLGFRLHHHPTLPHSRPDGFGAAGDPQFGVKRGEMEFDGVFADAQRQCDLFVCQAFRGQLQHFKFPPCQRIAHRFTRLECRGRVPFQQAAG